MTDQTYRLIAQLLNAMWGQYKHNDSSSTFKVYLSTPRTLYTYPDTSKESTYINRSTWCTEPITSDDMMLIYTKLAKYIGLNTEIKYLVSSNGKYVRLRFDTDTSKDNVEILVRSIIAKMDAILKSNTDQPAWVNSLAEPKTETKVVQRIKETKQMNDFSLTNLKNAIIDKVTHLDKKTITLLGILILLLLIATRYNDIKDILNGIKNKIAKSENFKAMKSDAAHAVDGLKKIIGVKKGDNDEA